MLIGISGGVDSSVAAYLLKESGYEVIGATLSLFNCDRVSDKSCCRREDKLLAQKICEQLGIKHHMIHAEERFKELVIDPFVEEYLNGRTPSPCIICNRKLKFEALMKKADELGCEFISTGHYCRIIDGRLVRGLDDKKDQSYFLFMLDKSMLGRVIFPLGDHCKKDVREIATKLNLPTSSKRESQEVCFVPDDDYVAYIEEVANNRLKGSGDYVDVEGNVIGKHKGIHAYTIGKRRALNLSLGKRKYVVRIDAPQNKIVIGDEKDLMSSSMVVEKLNWLEIPDFDKKYLVKIRYNHKGVISKLEASGDKIKVKFDLPQKAVTPGQAAVFYDGDVVVGGGWIAQV
ncbi:MAG: tRNA 2-thiouridine(34) synthase MnmA [Pseudomonadota bacterium]